MLFRPSRMSLTRGLRNGRQLLECQLLQISNPSCLVCLNQLAEKVAHAGMIELNIFLIVEEGSSAQKSSVCIGKTGVKRLVCVGCAKYCVLVSLPQLGRLNNSPGGHHLRTKKSFACAGGKVCCLPRISGKRQECIDPLRDYLLVTTRGLGK